MCIYYLPSTSAINPMWDTPMRECCLSHLPEEALKEISRDAAGKWQNGVTPEQTLRWSSRCSDTLPISCVGNIYLLHKLNSLLAFVVLY